MIKQTLAALVLVGAGAMASAADTSMSSTKFSDLDANRDGRVSAAEAQSHSQLTQGFRTADSNGDGYVSEAEFNAWTASTKTEPSTSESQSTTAPTDPATPQSTTP